MTLAELRILIDRIDTKILELLDERARVALEVGRVKKADLDAGQVAKARFYDPERERSVLGRLGMKECQTFPRTAIPFVFREIISACRSLETELKVAFLGPLGTYSHIASTQVFGSSVQYMEAATIESVFDAVGKGRAEYGVVPVENSYEGGVPATLDGLFRTPLSVRGEIVLRIRHCLLASHADLARIKKVYSHPQALGQCRNWLLKHLPHAERVTASSTSEAARIAKEDPTAAAIGSPLSADLFDLHTLFENIQDQDENSTRFLVLHSEDAPVTGHDKTSLALVPKSTPGAMAKILKAFDEHKTPLLRMESRASGQDRWQYVHFVDFAGHRLDARAKKLLKSLERHCLNLKVLGSYAAAPEIHAAELEFKTPPMKSARKQTGGPARSKTRGTNDRSPQRIMEEK